MPTEVGMLCTINGDIFYLLTKKIWIRDSGALCLFINNNISLFNVINIDKWIQGSSGSMPAIKKGKLFINVQQVDDTEWVHTLWPVKFFHKVGVNLFSLTCKHLQVNKISTDHWNNIMIKFFKGNIILDCQIKTNDVWVAGVDFLQETFKERA